MSSRREVALCQEEKDVDLDAVLEALGSRGRYTMTQLMLTIWASFVITVPTLDIVFTGYQPDYGCSQIDNVTQLVDYLPDDVTNFTVHDVSYQQCSIDVTVNSSSGQPSTHSLPCVAGVNFSMPADTSLLTEWSLVCDKRGLTQMTQTGVFGGQGAGYLVFSSLADRFGRKTVYITCFFCSGVAAIASAFLPNYYLYLVGRILVGFFAVGMIHPAYTMFMELLPQQWRCMASMMDSVMWVLAAVSMTVVAYLMQGVSWRYLSLAFSSVYVSALLLPWFLDESLRWMVATGRTEEAERILQKACRINGKDFRNIQAIFHKHTSANNMANPDDQVHAESNKEEMKNEMKVAEEKAKEEVINENKVEEWTTGAGLAGGDRGRTTETWFSHDCSDTDRNERGPGDVMKARRKALSSNYTVLDLFKHRAVLTPFLVCSFVWVTNNMYYYSVMLESAKLSGNRFLNFGLLNLQDIPSGLVALFLASRFNRRPLAFLYGTIAGVFLLISVGLVVLGGREVTLTLATVAQYLGKFSLAGSYILLFVYYMEVFPTRMRAIGTGTSGMVNRLSNIAVPFLIVWGEDTPLGPGVLMGCLCCVASLCIWLLPETRHRRLPDTVQQVKAWKKSNFGSSTHV